MEYVKWLKGENFQFYKPIDSIAWDINRTLLKPNEPVGDEDVTTKLSDARAISKDVKII
jgi:hypothetical protein